MIKKHIELVCTKNNRESVEKDYWEKHLSGGKLFGNALARMFEN